MRPFVIEVLDAQKEPVPLTKSGRLVFSFNLEPDVEPGRVPPRIRVGSVAETQTVPVEAGGKEKIEVSLGKLFDLKTPGKYTVQVQRLDYSGRTTKTVVKSNTLTITLTE